jgi:PIN domain nuclease of toxin-antitoxin system
VSERLLLDTHALIWALSAPRRLPAPVARAIRDPENDVAQALVEGLTIVTHDPAIARYAAPVLWT